MEITLRINGEAKVFTKDFVSAKVLYDAIALNETFAQEKGASVINQLDKLVDYVVKAFDNQFTADDVLEGLPAGQFQEELMQVFTSVLEDGGYALKSTI